MKDARLICCYCRRCKRSGEAWYLFRGIRVAQKRLEIA